jgi:hypothetical protein
MSIVVLCEALSKGRMNTTEFIIELNDVISKGGQINEVDEDGDSGLHKLVQLCSTYIEASRTMIQFGADVNYKSKKNMTPLYLAVSLYNVGMVRLLVAAGADPHLVISSNGTTAYKLNASMVKLIDDEIKWSTLGYNRNRITEYLNYDNKVASDDLQMVKAEIKKEQVLLVRKIIWQVGVAFQILELPALVLLKIIDTMSYSFRTIPMYIKWNMIVFIKNWKKQ